MKVKNSRIEALKMLISSQQLGSQEEVLQALQRECPSERRIQTDTSHTEPRLETVEGGKGSIDEREIRLCASQ